MLNAEPAQPILNSATNTLNESAGAGSIIAAGLTGNTSGAILTGSNAIASLGNFNTSGGNFTLENAQALSITGTLNAGSGTADFELGHTRSINWAVRVPSSLPN